MLWPFPLHSYPTLISGWNSTRRQVVHFNSAGNELKTCKHRANVIKHRCHLAFAPIAMFFLGVQVSLVCAPTPQQGVSREVCCRWGSGIRSSHSKAGRGGRVVLWSKYLLSVDWQLLTWLPAGRHFASAGEKEGKKKESHQEQNARGSDGRKRGESDLREVNQQLQLSHLTTGS